jgi:hypothetical protein
VRCGKKAVCVDIVLDTCGGFASQEERVKRVAAAALSSFFQKGRPFRPV